MSDIQYDEPQYAQPAASRPAAPPSQFARLLMRARVAKNERSANTLLIIIILFCIVATFVVIHMSAAPQQNLNVPLGPPTA